MAGFLVGEIAMFTGTRRAVALGIAQKGPFPIRRIMTLEDRQRSLDELKAARHSAGGELVDGELLPDRLFVVQQT